MAKVYNEVRRKPRVRTVNTDPELTVQSDKVRSDIRHILAKYSQTGLAEYMQGVDLSFRDVSEFTDFADLMRQSKQAEAQFMKLPSKVREVFNHNVADWLDAAHDPAKLDAVRPQLEKLGVFKPTAAPVAPAATVVPPSAPAAGPAVP